MMKRIAALLLTLAVALCAALPVFAAGTIEVTEDEIGRASCRERV